MMRNNSRATDGNELYSEQPIKFMHGGTSVIAYLLSPMHSEYGTTMTGSSGHQPRAL